MPALSEDLELTPLHGDPLPLRNQLKLFQLFAIVLDPYTAESSWILPTAQRILNHFQGADCRPSLVLTTDEAGALSYLDHTSDDFLVFLDPERTFVAELGLETLPALVHLDLNLEIVGAAEGWQPEQWRELATNLAATTHWSRPEIPKTGDPIPFVGTKASGDDR